MKIEISLERSPVFVEACTFFPFMAAELTSFVDRVCIGLSADILP